jgi:hypothetical protein
LTGGTEMPVGLGLAALVSNVSRYGSPFHLGPIGMPAPLSWFPHPARSSNAPAYRIMPFLTSSSLFFQKTRNYTTPFIPLNVIADSRPNSPKRSRGPTSA